MIFKIQSRNPFFLQMKAAVTLGFNVGNLFCLDKEVFIKQHKSIYVKTLQHSFNRGGDRLVGQLLFSSSSYFAVNPLLSNQDFPLSSIGRSKLNFPIYK